MYNSIKAIYKKWNIQSSVVTQMGRKTGASYAENCGAQSASVNKIGHWRMNSHDGAYAKHVSPWGAARVLARFQAHASSYHIPRAEVVPPEELQKKIFPSLNESIEVSTCQSGIINEPA